MALCRVAEVAHGGHCDGRRENWLQLGWTVCRLGVAHKTWGIEVGQNTLFPEDDAETQLEGLNLLVHPVLTQ